MIRGRAVCPACKKRVTFPLTSAGRERYTVRCKCAHLFTVKMRGADIMRDFDKIVRDLESITVNGKKVVP